MYVVGKSDVWRSYWEGCLLHLPQGQPGHHPGQAQQNPGRRALRSRCS